jgi:hypothetical protein
MNDLKYIRENIDYRELTGPLSNYMLEIAFNSNIFQLIRINNSQFTSILYLLREDITLIFGRFKEAHSPKLLEIDFLYPSLLRIIFSISNPHPSYNFTINTTKLHILPSRIIEIITLFNQTNINNA